jgi:hypothetical protein
VGLIELFAGTTHGVRGRKKKEVLRLTNGVGVDHVVEQRFKQISPHLP